MTYSSDKTIFDKRPKFLLTFLFVSLFGVLLISLASYHASRELEVVHEINNMSQIIRALLGEKKLAQLLSPDYHPDKDKNNFFGNTSYGFFILSNKQLLPLQDKSENTMRFLNSFDIESSRINEHGGFYEADGKIRTWVKFQVKNSNNHLLVVHKFSRSDVSKLMNIYKKRVIIPVFFYLLLMVWVALIFNHLLQKLKIQKDQMEHMALHDALTGLANRNLLDDRLTKLIQTSHRDKKQFAFSIIDIDGFKGINDKYGHDYGDELLRQVAKRLKGLLRESDTAARLGGDEFVVMLSDIDGHAWYIAFERILGILTEPYTLFKTKITISTSIGVSIYPEHGNDTSTLLRNADLSMYAIKAKGGGIQIHTK